MFTNMFACVFNDLVAYVEPPVGKPGRDISANSALQWLFGGDFYTFLVAAAIVSALVCGLTVIFSSDPKVIDDAKRWLVNIVLALAVYMSLKKWIYS